MTSRRIERWGRSFTVWRCLSKQKPKTTNDETRKQRDCQSFVTLRSEQDAAAWRPTSVLVTSLSVWVMIVIGMWTSVSWAGSWRASQQARVDIRPSDATPTSPGRQLRQRSQLPPPARINRKHRRLVSDERTNNFPKVNNVGTVRTPRTRRKLSNKSIIVPLLSWTIIVPNLLLVEETNSKTEIKHSTF